MTPAERAVLDRALRYPYERPTGSFEIDLGTGRTRVARPDRLADATRRRTAVLAVGSNAAPEQLRRKFAGSTGTVPVVRVRVRDHDVVHAARLSRYGAVPATSTPSPGTAVSVHVTFLDDDQLEVMHRSESVGRAYRVRAVDPRLVDCPVPVGREVLTYDAVSGPLLLDGSPAALATVPAAGRRVRSLHQGQVLASVAHRLGTTVRDLVLGVAADGARHAEVNDRLAAGSVDAIAQRL